MTDKLQVYRQCMSEKMTGQKFETREDRWREFCVQAKICSSKAKDREEGIKLCKEVHPDWEWD